MLKKLMLLSLVVFLTGCGGATDSSESDGSTEEHNE